MIQIALCTDDNYVMPTGVLINSIETTNKNESIKYNIVSEHLTEESKDKLKNCLNNPNSSIEFYFINKDMLKDCPVRIGDHITLATYYRILFPTIFSEEISKILYLDGDMLCVDSITDLWNEDITNYSSGVVIDIYANDIRRQNRLDLPLDYEFFNAGMMLINLDYWRKNDIQNQTLKYISENQEACIAHDQDGLNKTLCGTTKILNPKYNLQLDFWQNPKKLLVQKKHFNTIEEATKNPCILHFTGSEKPWHKECLYPLKNLWVKFLNLTQWKGLKLTNKYKGKRLLKYHLRNFLEKIGFVECQNPYKNIDVKDLEDIIQKKFMNEIAN